MYDVVIVQRKLFARRDYEGLGEEAREYLKKRRSELAKEIVEERKNPNSIYNKSGKVDKLLFEVDNPGKDYLKSSERRKNIQGKIDSIKKLKDNSREGAEDIDKIYKRREERNKVFEEVRNRINDIENNINNNNTSNTTKGKWKNKKDIVDAVIIDEKKPVSSRISSSSFLKKYKKPLLIGGSVAALGGAGIYGYKKLKKNKE